MTAREPIAYESELKKTGKKAQKPKNANPSAFFMGGPPKMAKSRASMYKNRGKYTGETIGDRLSNSTAGRVFRAFRDQKPGEPITKAYADTGKPKVKGSTKANYTPMGSKPAAQKAPEKSAKMNAFRTDTKFKGALKTSPAVVAKKKPAAAKKEGFNFGAAIARGFGGEEAWKREKAKAGIKD